MGRVKCWIYDMNTRWIKIYPTLWWDEDHRYYGCPITIAFHTRKTFYYWRPFCRKMLMKWPENPDIWNTLEKKRKHETV